MGSKIEAAFIDRDGTIGGTGHFVHPDDFTLYPNAQTAIDLLKSNRIKVFAFTNQHRISRGEATIWQFENQFKAYGFDGAYICPHGMSEECECRKPKPGMLHRASAEHGLDLTRCVVIGDVGDTDLLAAHQVGAQKIMVKTGWGEGSLGAFRHRWKETEPDFVAADILEAVQWIVGRERAR